MSSKAKDRRVARRVPIRVLVKCLPSEAGAKGNGREFQGWEMWAEDLGDDGVGLVWSRDWAARNYVLDLDEMDLRPSQRSARLSGPPLALMKKGRKILLEGLVYNEKGSKVMRGQIQWSRAAKSGRKYEFGVRITSPDRRSYFRALAV